MTTTFKSLLALLLLLASWTGQAQADAAPPTQTVAQAEAGQVRKPETADRLAWQRVGAPISLQG